MAAEKAFENKIKKFLEASNNWYLKYWAGAQFTKEGVPDILACVNGKFIAIEIKAPKGKPTLLQLVNLRKIRESGGIGILLYPDDFEMFKTYLNYKCADICVADTYDSVTWYVKNIDKQEEWFSKLNS